MVEVPVKIYMANLAKKAKASAHSLSLLSTAVKNQALLMMADRVADGEEAILAANVEDVETVGKHLGREANKEAVDRLRFSPKTIETIADGLRRVADLQDPVGMVTKVWRRPNGMEVSRVRVPLGVIGVISELGPVSTVETVALCLKSGNVCILRAGSEWNRTHQVMMTLLCEAAAAAGVPAGAISFVERSEKEGAVELMRLNTYVDAIVARGGPGLRKAVLEQAKMPVLCADGGVCHVYIDADADLPLAQNIVVNSKVQDPTQPNSADTILVHQSIARPLLPALARRLLDEFRIEVRGCPKTMALAGTSDLPHYTSVKEASEEDWGRQFLNKFLAVRVVNDMDEALAHIARYGPGHADVIVTRDYAAAMRFAREVDSSAVLVNASTRLHEGEQYGLGGQVGVNLGRMHARGPIALEELTCQKYVVLGTGQLRFPHPVPTAYEDAIMLKKGAL
jgi:glutamate-5-semialdehyde dehydrogenase